MRLCTMLASLHSDPDRRARNNDTPEGYWRFTQLSCQLFTYACGAEVQFAGQSEPTKGFDVERYATSRQEFYTRFLSARWW